MQHIGVLHRARDDGYGRQRIAPGSPEGGAGRKLKWNLVVELLVEALAAA